MRGADRLHLKSAAVARTLVCIAPRGLLSRRAALEIAAELPGVTLAARSISGYLAAPGTASPVLLCPAGRSVASDIAFLRCIAQRLLWPAPSADFRDAIGGLRTRGTRVHATLPPERRRRTGGLATALLLEGRVGPERVRAALASSGPRDWIVETPRHVQLPDRLRRAVEQAGIRWSALDPVEVVALYAGHALMRARARWRPLLPPGTPVWIRDS